mgnify:CR=1 FL=1
MKNTLAIFIPKSMIYKKKKVFSVPMKTWLRNELKEDLINHIFNKSFYGGKMINVIEVKK